MAFGLYELWSESTTTLVIINSGNVSILNTYIFSNDVAVKNYGELEVDGSSINSFEKITITNEGKVIISNSDICSGNGNHYFYTAGDYVI